MLWLLWLLVFLLVWLLVTSVLAVVSGWRALAAAFPGPADVDGDHFSFATADIGSERTSVRYRACLFVTIGEAGLRLSTFFAWPLSNPPLFIPWREVQVEETPSRFFRAVTIRPRGIPVAIRFRGELARCALEAWARAGHPSN